MESPAAARKPAVLPALDRAAIRRAAETRVAEQLHRYTHPETIARHAAEIADTATSNADELRAQRNMLALSLTVHERRRTVYRALGINRAAYIRVRKRFPPATVPHVPDALERLPGLAVETATAEETARAALKHRDEAVGRLTEAGWTHPQVAELIGVNRSRVAQIRSRDARRAGAS
jgi:hypothetical protein